MSGAVNILLSTNRRAEGTDIWKSSKLLGAESVFRPMLEIADEVLAPKNHVKQSVSENTTRLLLPIIGAVSLRENADADETLLAAGQIVSISYRQHEIENPYDDQQINYLLIDLEGIGGNLQQPSADKNVLQKIFDRNDIELFLGIFDGRQEAEIASDGKKLLVFVINGAFECQGRLLETRDGLWFEKESDIDLEALSGNAIVLLARYETAN